MISIDIWPDVSGQNNPNLLNSYRSMKEDRTIELNYFSIKSLFRLPDITHIHWPEYFFVGSRWRRFIFTNLFFFLLWKNRLFGGKILWTVHNIVPHDQAIRCFYITQFKRFFKNIDAVILMNNTSGDRIRQVFDEDISEKETFFVRHSHYLDNYNRAADRKLALQKLKLEEEYRYVLMLGFIKPYKNVPALIKRFLISGDKNVRLIIAGKVENERLRNEILGCVSGLPDGRVSLFLDFIPDDDLRFFFAAADASICSFENIENSGSALLSLSFGTPVICLDHAILRELSDNISSKFFRIFENMENLEVTNQVLDQLAKPTDEDLVKYWSQDHQDGLRRAYFNVLDDKRRVAWK